MQLCHFATSHFGRFRDGLNLAIPNEPAPSGNSILVRFDDRLSTILKYPAQDVAAKSAIWVQMVDLLAQEHGAISRESREQAFELLEQWRPEIPERRRLAASVAVAGRTIDASLVAFLSQDTAQVAAPILVRAKLSGPDWQAIIAKMPSASRALLRERRDLPQEASSALSAFGTSDFALPTAESGILELGGMEQPSAIPIGELVKRIEAFKEKRTASRPGAFEQSQKLSSFAFECDADGLINWVEGAPRGALIGTSVAQMADPGGFGVDGRASGAFRKRDSIRDACLAVPGHGDAAGDWLISAEPYFDAQNGRFCGYRGVARRRKPDSGQISNPFGSGMSSESIRQLVHELRTPLNAIRGFAEMIEGQFLGSVDMAYRKRAESIVEESGRLLRVFEDLDVSARLSAGEDSGPVTEIDLCRVVRQAASNHAALASSKAVKLQVALPSQPALALVDEASASRLVDRLLMCVLATSAPGETLKSGLRTTDSHTRFSVSRPQALRNVDDAVLLDPTTERDSITTNEDIPLGLAFLLRLIRQIARKQNGRLEIGTESFVLILPRRGDSAEATIESN